MTGVLLSVVSEAERNAFPSLAKLSENDVDSIWLNVSSFIERQMSVQKGVHIVGLGTFTFSQQKLDVGNKHILIQRPIFLLSEKFSRSCGLKQVKPLAAGDVPVVMLNFTTLAVDSPFDRDTVEGCVRETLLLLRRAVASGRSVLFTFTNIGILSFRHSKVKMKFYRDFISAMDGTGRLLMALINRPGTSSSLVSGRVSSPHRPRTGNTIALPKISTKRPENEKEEETCFLPSEPGGGEENEGEMERSTRPKSRPKSRAKTRQTLPLAKVNGISSIEDLEGKAPAEGVESCATTSQPLEGALKEVKRADASPSRACPDHTRAGQELCYLCMQRAQRNIPVYLAEERRRQDLEEERVLLYYQLQKEQQYLQKERADRVQMRVETQKVAAFNLGVAEALRGKRGARPSDFHSSYIFRSRPCTPPRLPKQQRYMQELMEQATLRRNQHFQSQQDQATVDRQHQVQLANEIASQKAKRFHQKLQKVKEYQDALDEQMEHREEGIPARQPDSDGPIFGAMDCNPVMMAEQRQRAEIVFKEQVDTANQKRREALLNRLDELKREGEMLQRNRKELMEDRIDQYDKLHNLRTSLENTWSHSANLKHHRDQEEKDFIRAGSQLLIDQCQQYRRCYQCKRRPENCGESNIWKESRYISGFRLIV